MSATSEPAIDCTTGFRLFHFAFEAALKKRGNFETWSEDQRHNTENFLYHNNYNVRKTLQDAALLIPTSQEEENLPEWDESIIPTVPYSKSSAAAAVARFESGEQNEQNPWGLRKTTAEEEAEGLSEIADSHVAPPIRKRYLLERLDVSLVARRNLQDQYHNLKETAEEMEKQLAVYKAQSVDHFLYSFWPPLPWTEVPQPLRTGSMPSEWASRNPRPMRQFKQTVPEVNKLIKDWETNRDANQADWLRSLAYHPDHDENENNSWHGVRYLGKGTYGYTGLWVRADEKNVITERMAVKECAPNMTWHCPTEWRGRTAREVRMHQLIDGTRTAKLHRNLLRHTSHRLMMVRKRYRLYMDLCDGGRLANVLYDYLNREPELYAPPNTTPEIPESFLWHIFSGLVDACLVLKQGHLDEPVENWRPLVHNDLHLGNVLLQSDPDADEWPNVVLIDFGRMFYDLHPERKSPRLGKNDNPISYRVGGRNGRYPPVISIPETIWAHLGSVRITSKSDVWQIGQVMWTLLSHSVNDSNGPVLDTPARRAVNIGPFDLKDLLNGTLFPVVRRYSERLKHIVRTCLKFDPKQRPILDDLKNVIKITQADLARKDPVLREPDPFGKFAVGKKYRS